MNVSALAVTIVKSPLTKKIVVSVAGVIASFGASFLVSKGYDKAFDPNDAPFKGIFDN